MINFFKIYFERVVSTKIILIAGILFLGLFRLVGNSEAEIIPSARIIDWSQAGVSGGLPERSSVVDCTQSPYNIPSDGLSDVRNSLQNCLNGIGNNQVAYLPAGTYRLISGGITIPANKTLRGAGRRQTVILSTYDTGYYAGIITMSTYPVVWATGVWPCPSTTFNIVGGSAKGDNVINLNSVSGLNVGQVVVASRLNGTGGQFDDGTTILPTECDYCGICGGTRAMTQLTEIESVDINAKTVTVNPPMTHSFESAFSPQIGLLETMVGNSGLEDLTINNQATGSQDGVNIALEWVKDSWVKNVESINGFRRNVMIIGGLRNTVRDSYFWTESFDKTAGGIPDHNYGVSLQNASSFNLIENNIFDNLIVGVGLDGGPGSGNVIAYNYVNRQYYCGSNNPGCAAGSNDSQFLQASIASHSSHPTHTLLEGNQIRKFMTDYIHGSSAYGLLFRNNIIGEYNWLSNEHDLTKTWGLWLVLDMAYNTHYSLVGNVLGYPGMSEYIYQTSSGMGVCSNEVMNIFHIGYDSPFGCSNFDPNVLNSLYRHGNYDYVNNTTAWDQNNADRTIPSSMYLSIKPSWWCNETPWPPIGSDLPLKVSDIPAKRKYDNQACTIASGDTTPPAAPTSLTVM